MMRKAARWLTVLALFSGAACAGRGREVFVREGCVNCHRFKEIGGGPGPVLSEVATRRDSASLRDKITNPSADPASRMPAFNRISWFDLHSLVAFLRS
jgi:mono/diheme cytochrome c family protein